MKHFLNTVPPGEKTVLFLVRYVLQIEVVFFFLKNQKQDFGDESVKIKKNNTSEVIRWKIRIFYGIVLLQIENVISKH